MTDTKSQRTFKAIPRVCKLAFMPVQQLPTYPGETPALFDPLVATGTNRQRNRKLATWAANAVTDKILAPFLAESTTPFGFHSCDNCCHKILRFLSIRNFTVLHCPVQNITFNFPDFFQG